MSSWMRVVVGLVVAAASGALFRLAFPPYDLWPLIFVAFVPAVFAQHRLMPRAFSGLAYGVGFGLYFWSYYGPIFANTAWFMEWLPLFVFIIAWLASNGDRAFNERSNYRWFVLQGAVVWVAIEAIRGFIPYIGTGGFVASALWRQNWLLQPVGLFSIYGLSLLIMLVNYALALVAIALFDAQQKPAEHSSVQAGQAVRWLAGVALVVIAWSGLSAVLLGQAQADGAALRVAAVQPGAASGTAKMQSLLEQSRQAAAEGAQLIVWPEGALDFDVNQTRTTEIQALARETGAYLAIGHALSTPQGLRNEVTLVAPDGQLLGTYGKDHPVVWAGETSVTGGTYPTYATSLGTIATIICYDLNFSDTSRKMAAGGAGLIAVSSNDSSAIGALQPSNLVLRAVENRVALVKADTAYDSVVIAADGEIVSLASSTTPLATKVLASVRLGRADAPLIALGDWLGWLAIAGMIAFFVADPLTRRRDRAPRSLQAGAAGVRSG